VRALGLLALLLATGAAPRFEDRASVERGIVMLRLDPRMGAEPGECDDLAATDVRATIGRRPARVIAVERVPRPERHWLLLDISQSAKGRREEAKRSALDYLRDVMQPGMDIAAVVTIDEDAILVAGPSSDPAALAAAVEKIDAGGWSALRDGLDVVLRQVAGDRHEHAILYWTDGEDQSSLTHEADLLATVDRTPNATVFPIALVPNDPMRLRLGARVRKEPPKPLVGVTFTRVATHTGGEVFLSSDRRWLDRVRGWLRRRFTVAFAPPETEDGSPARGSLAITVPQKRCGVTLLDDPFARPDAIAGAALPLPRSWTKLAAKAQILDGDPCASNGDVVSWDWPFRVNANELSGCVLDLTQSGGRVMVRKPSGSIREETHGARVAPRSVRILAPPLASLPAGAVDAVEGLPESDDLGVEPGPHFMEGGALLAQRGRMASSLFAARSDYREFALSRLDRLAKDELRSIEADFARAFPDLPAGKIAEVARASRAGSRALEAARTPTDADLARVLAAWIRDVPASALLRDLERNDIDARLRGDQDARLEARWMTLRNRFAFPSRVRVEAPLVLVHDPGQDVVGFVRIVPPRPEAFSRADGDRVDVRPLALATVERAMTEPAAARALAAGKYHVTATTYERLPPPIPHDTLVPATRSRVVVSLEGAGDVSARSVTLDADLTASETGPIVITRFDSRVTGDPRLAEALAPLKRSTE